ncbi:DUF892 family protein [Pedomonas mirosovicensis]|uniref:DUF892 family protein n=1 Tax=Pedomonas mirosovicensis TaxID=2908641 RepID=UPI0021673AEA|nr:DUF892 family protein [Pedomonas mirosovicensis]MCH8686321.1 DUF892 family protein [Pedomonas mirosovicensis]
MANRSAEGNYYHARRNVTGTERVLSILGGIALLAGARRGSLAKRALFGLASASLLARGATRYCPMKARMTDNVPLGQGYANMFRIMAKPFMSGTASIDNFNTLYINELQELHNAKAQMEDLLETLETAVEHGAIREHLGRYRTQIQHHQDEIAEILQRCEAAPEIHEDDAMEALVHETEKMRKVSGSDALRDAGIVASLQRLIHHQIAGLGTAATYAKTMDRMSEAEILHRIMEEDKAVDDQLSAMAKELINPAAAGKQDIQAAVPAGEPVLP